MRLRSITSAALGLGLLLLGSAAAAVDPGCRLIRGANTPDTADDVQVCRQDTWMHGAGSRLDNLSAAQGTVPSWNTTQPTATLQDGGSGYAAVGLSHYTPLTGDRRVKPTFSGTYTGILDNLAATIYLSCPLYQATGTPFPLSIVLKVDGETILNRSALNSEIDVPIIAVNEQYGYIKVAFTNMYNALDSLELDNAADTQHTIEIQMINFYWGDGHTVVLYDATDAPTGNVFNIEPNKLGPFTRVDTFAEVSG